MRKIIKKWLPVAGTLVLTAALAACGDADADSGEPHASASGGTGELSGTIRIDGSSTVAPLSEAAAELFMAENPGVRVTVATSGTGGGFEAFCRGDTEISDASRPIAEDEIAACGSSGIDFEQVTVANDALSVLVHPDNPVDCLTVDQLHQIWGPDSTLSSWSEIDGLEPAFDAELDLYGPGTDSGTFDYFTDAINGEEGAQRTDYNNIGEDDNTGILGVEGTEGGMFYVGFSYYVENQDRVKALAIDGGNGCVEPSLATVQDGGYAPLGRGLFIYPSGTALAKPEVRAFVEFYLNNQAAIAEAAGYIPLTADQEREALDTVAGLVG